MAAANNMYPAFGKQLSNWFSHSNKGGKNGAPNIIRFAIRLGEVDVVMARRAFEELVRKHESLRTVFTATGAGVMQVVVGYREREYGLLHTVCKTRQHFDHKRRGINRRIEKTLGNLEEGPLFKGVLYEVMGQGYFLEISIHHIISDAWSIKLISDELFAIYESGGMAGKEEAGLQLSGYATRHLTLNNEGMTKRYWQKKLEDLPEGIEVDRLYASYNAAVNSKGIRNTYKQKIGSGWIDISRMLQTGYGHTFSSFIKEGIIEKVNGAAAKYKTTPSIIILSVFLLLMRRLYQTHETLIISRLNGRFDIMSREIVGNFTCAVYSYIREPAIKGMAHLVEMVRKDFLDGLDHPVYNPLLLQEVPLTANCHLCVNILTDELNEGDSSHNKLIKTPINTYFPLEVVVVFHKSSIHFNWIYNTLLFRSSMLQFIAGEHLKMLHQLIAG
jgi:hypothetical protein